MVGLIIFGRRNRPKVVQRGSFTCPRCGPGREYEHKQVRRWFTLYFIPIIPLGTAGEYVECRSCAGTFRPEVLRLALPNAQLIER
jgi:zinc ribbon protein